MKAPSLGRRLIALAGGHIYSADKRIRWPGKAAVVVVRVWVCKRPSKDVPCVLNGKNVSAISSYLLRSNVNAAPAPLTQSQGIAFKGTELGSQGFVIDDDEGCVLPAELSASATINPACCEIVKPYMGGEELNEDLPGHFRRSVVDLVGIGETEALARYSPLVELVRSRVTCDRSSRKSDIALAPWWEHWRSRPEMRAACKGLEQKLAASQTSKYLIFSLVPGNVVLSHKTVVLASQSDGLFTCVQSRAHESWSSAFGSSMKDDPVYTPSDCFETFPFPDDWKTSEHLAIVGRHYREFRALMVERRLEGLTKIYNRFHDPSATDADVVELRELHATMDRTVLDAYGWSDIQPICEFNLDYEEEEDEGDTSRGRRKKKPWRYRWSDDVRDEVLARLLELNVKRAKAQVGTMPSVGPGTSSEAVDRGRKRTKAVKKPAPKGQSSLFGGEDE